MSSNKQQYQFWSKSLTNTESPDFIEGVSVYSHVIYSESDDIKQGKATVKLLSPHLIKDGKLNTRSLSIESLSQRDAVDLNTLIEEVLNQGVPTVVIEDLYIEHFFETKYLAEFISQYITKVQDTIGQTVGDSLVLLPIQDVDYPFDNLNEALNCSRLDKHSDRWFILFPESGI